jgi:hypothetical protein
MDDPSPPMTRFCRLHSDSPVPRRSATRTRRLTWSLAAIGLATTQACASFDRLPVGAVPPGRDVRVELTSTGAMRLGGSIGARARFLTGRTEGSGPDGLLLAVSTIVRDDGNEESLNGTPVTIPEQEIAGVESRRIDRSRTAIAALMTIAGTVLVSRAVTGGTSGGRGREGGGSGQQ